MEKMNKFSGNQSTIVGIYNRYVKPYLYMDYRSLACLRIMISIYLIIDVFARMVYVGEHYSSWGEYPTSMAIHPNRMSLHVLSGSTPFQVILMLIAVIIHFSMCIGYRTTLSTVLSYIMLVSIQNRNHYLLDGSDDYIRVMLFWCMFLPLGHCYSVDSLKLNSVSLGRLKQQSTDHNNNEEMNDIEGGMKLGQLKHHQQQQDYKYLSFGTIGYGVQFACIYLFTALLKQGVDWHYTYDAVYYAISLREFSYGISNFLLQYPEMLKLLTRFTLFFEYAGPLLFFSPFYNSICRIVSVLGFTFMHFGFGACLNLYLFIFIPMVCVSGFIPSMVWDYLTIRINSVKERYTLKIYFDQNFKGIEYILSLFKHYFLISSTPIIKINKSSLQQQDSNIKSSHSMGFDKHYVVVEFDNEYYYEYEAFIVLISQSYLLWPLEKILNTNFFYKISPLFNYLIEQGKSVKLYKYLNNNDNSDKQKEKDHGELESPLSTGSLTELLFNNIFAKVLLSIFLIGCIIYVPTLNYHKLHQKDVPIIDTAMFLGLDQYWGMFAPSVPKTSNWLMVDAQFEKMDHYDILNNRKQIDHTLLPTYTFNSGQRQRNFIMGVLFTEELRLGFGRWICRKWNIYDGPHEEWGILKTFQIITVQRFTQNPEFLDLPVDYKTSVIWSHQC